MKSCRCRVAALASMLVVSAVTSVLAGEPARGPLRVSKSNSRYFTDGTGKAVYLTGSHVWNNLVDMGPSDPPPSFQYDAYLDWMEKQNQNFIRLWTWELLKWDTVGNSPKHRTKPSIHTVFPHPWARTGPGRALDGKPLFDLEKYCPEYFKRLRSRVIAAGKRGIYVSIMLFEGWGLQRVPEAWKSHPLHPRNNLQGVDGDVNGDGKGLEVHTLGNAAVTRIQEAYVKRVIDTVNDLDNVLYEISNENHPPSTEWQYHMIRFIHRYEKEKPEQHPVGMTFQFSGGTNRALFESPAEWISPNNEGGYRDNPPAADGSKVILTDTDHLWGIGGSADWVWKSFLRGLNPIFMDPYDGVVLGDPKRAGFPELRRALGRARSYAERLKLVSLKPRGDLASTRYCLACPGSEYLVYRPPGDRKPVSLTTEAGSYRYEWFDPAAGKVVARGTVELAKEKSELRPPIDGSVVLYLKR